MKRYFVVVALAILILVTPFNSASFADTNPASESVVTVAKPFTYTVRNGDNLTRVAARFNVSIEELLARNPRKTANLWLYRGEKLEIPQMYHAVQVPEKKVAPLDFVMSQAIDLKASEEKIAAVTEELANAKILRGYLTSAIIAVLITMIGLVIMFMRSSPKQNAQPVNVTQFTLENKSAADIADLLKAADGRTLDALARSVVFKNERGDVLFRNIPDYLVKRPHLLNVPVSQWEDANKQEEIAKKTLQIPIQGARQA